MGRNRTCEILYSRWFLLRDVWIFLSSSYVFGALPLPPPPPSSVGRVDGKGGTLFNFFNPNIIGQLLAWRIEKQTSSCVTKVSLFLSLCIPTGAFLVGILENPAFSTPFKSKLQQNGHLSVYTGFSRELGEDYKIDVILSECKMLDAFEKWSTPDTESGVFRRQIYIFYTLFPFIQ